MENHFLNREMGNNIFLWNLMRLANFKRVQFAVIGLTNDSETAKILAPPFVNKEESFDDLF
jgi:hypothetical protein